MDAQTVKVQSGEETKRISLFSLTWPIFLELFLFTLIGITDTFMLSGVSDEAVSAVGAANQFVFIAILVLEVIGHGASIVVAQYIGSRKLDEAAKIGAIAITLNLMIGILISIGFLLLGSALLSTMNLQGEILKLAQSYTAIVGGGLFLQAIINTLASMIRTYGYTRESMLISLGINIVHVVGNYLLIFGNGGFPELGVEGAAISTVFSRGLGLIVFFWAYYRLIEYKVELKDYVTITKSYVSKICSVGIPSAFEQITYNGCQAIFLYYVTFLGAAALASRQYVLNISMFIYLFSLAIGMGTAIITGRLVGAGRQEEAYQRVWVSLRWGFLCTVIINIVVIVFREPIMGLFTNDPDILRISTQVILLSIFLETGRVFNIILINSLRAAGDAKFPVYMGLISMVGVSLPLGYVLAFHANLGLAGVWLAVAADEWIRAVVMFFRWRSRAWERKSLVDPS
ncbi:MATE family efflux transporter [Brevibacillus choshinensis]|uniref:MATE family efflux transporter n=1 Tax=Brevibacillus choshinensis TaxID=54911 RepID=A0ABR5N836_BRECH|nr:MATE family efflux transporter [Brevibacillus choshinensis]KQL46792.1 MATE family efflux transporter [Brevibacillus choshinensis]